jgi:hypothetical protein
MLNFYPKTAVFLVFFALNFIFVKFSFAIIINEAGFTDRFVATFPFASGNGDIEFDSNGVAYVHNGSRGQIYSIDQADNVALVSTVPAGAPYQQVRGIALVGNVVFFDTIGDFYTADSPASTLFASSTNPLARQTTDLELAPAGAEFAGKLVALTGSFGSLVVIDPGTAAVTTFANCCNRTSSIEYYNSVLYGVGGISRNILYSISPTSGNTLIANLGTLLGTGSSAAPMELDGLAIDPLTGDFYMANGRLHQIIKYTASGVASVFATDVFFDSGAGLSPISFTPDGTNLYYGAKRGSSTGEYHAISGFAGILPPILQVKIQELYVGILGRAADRPGLDYWHDQINAGFFTLENTRAAFTDPAQTEYTEIYGGLNNTQLVTAIYANFLERPPEVAGLQYWVGELNSGRVNADQMINAIINAVQDPNATGALSAADLATLQNKTAAAIYFTEVTKDYMFDLAYREMARAVVADVTDDPETLAQAKAMIDEYVGN